MIHPVAARFGATLLGPVKQLPQGVEFSFALTQPEIDGNGLALSGVKPDREINARLTQAMDPAPAKSWWGKALMWFFPKTLETTLKLSYFRGWVNDLQNTRELLLPSQNPGNYKMYSPLSMARPTLQKLLQTLPEALADYQPALRHAARGEWKQTHVYIPKGMFGRVMSYTIQGDVPSIPGHYTHEVRATQAQANMFAAQAASTPSEPYTFIVPEGSGTAK